jgi:hypothetical protein
MNWLALIVTFIRLAQEAAAQGATKDVYFK